MNDLEKNIGYVFKNKNLIKQALTHSSATADIHRNYERLEFLGDRILGLTVADMLCHTFADEPEGDLAQRFVGLVCKETVAEIMRSLNIVSHIIAANLDVCDKDNVLCDVGEALIAAIYLDSGDLKIAQDFIERNWRQLIDQKSQPKKDYKTLLQEKSAQLKLNAPVYEIVEKTGPEHAPKFVVSVNVGYAVSAYGKGSSKKHAEQQAAEEMLKILDAAHE